MKNKISCVGMLLALLWIASPDICHAQVETLTFNDKYSTREYAVQGIPMAPKSKLLSKDAGTIKCIVDGNLPDSILKCG